MLYFSLRLSPEGAPYSYIQNITGLGRHETWNKYNFLFTGTASIVYPSDQYFILLFATYMQTKKEISCHHRRW